MQFSDKLKELRKSKNTTQEELANNIFISRSVIAKYESGFANPTKENLEKIGNYFNVPLSYFIDDKNHKKTKIRNIESYALLSFFLAFNVFVFFFLL
mgnify:CR=1 FL=1